jgi:hypothetical protein
MSISEIMGIIGLLLITVGVLIKKRKEEDVFYIIGGICLEVYSVHIHDDIFIVLQIVFILSAIYDLATSKQ